MLGNKKNITPFISRSSVLLILLFFTLSILNLSAQVKDTAYFDVEYKKLIKLKNTLNDSVFIEADRLEKEIREANFNHLIPPLRLTVANYYYRKEDLGKALIMYQKVLDSAIINKDKKSEINAKESIANVYQFLGEHQKVVTYFSEGFNYWKLINDERFLARSARNIAESQIELGNFNEALLMLDTALTIYKKRQDTAWVVLTYYLIADVYIQQNIANKTTPDEATIQKIEFAIKEGRSYFSQDLYDTPFEGAYYLLSAHVAFYQTNFQEAVNNGEKAYTLLSKESLNSKSEIPELCMLLAKSYDNLGMINKAIEYLKTYSQYRDSLSFINRDELARGHTLKVDYKNKRAEEELSTIAKVTQEKVEHEAYLSRQKTYYVIGGMVLLGLIILLFIIFRRHQKLKWFYLQLFERTKDLTDSINYAERIQKSMLPIDAEITKAFKEHFILYKPKHIVAGDFYWFVTRENYTYLAVADCTGHGVPGALVSLVCHEALERSLIEFNLSDTNAILDKTRELVKTRFKHAESASIKDGMDIALCRIDKNTNKVQFSGANNPLWILRGNEMLSYSGDKQPIGEYFAETPFTAKEEQIIQGDLLYLFSDGYIDQFGGETGKKFKTPNFRKLILKIAGYQLQEQGNLLNKNFENWKGNMEQIDDVCVIGVKF